MHLCPPAARKVQSRSLGVNNLNKQVARSRGGRSLPFNLQLSHCLRIATHRGDPVCLTFACMSTSKPLCVVSGSSAACNSPRNRLHKHSNSSQGNSCKARKQTSQPAVGHPHTTPVSHSQR